jgi:hypothetical protein
VRDIRFRFRHEHHQAERRPGAGSAGDRRQQFVGTRLGPSVEREIIGQLPSGF